MTDRIELTELNAITQPCGCRVLDFAEPPPEKIRCLEATDRFDDFTINMYQDDEGDYLAHFVELPSVSAFAATPEEALNELAEAWAGVRESYEKRG